MNFNEFLIFTYQWPDILAERPPVRVAVFPPEGFGRLLVGPLGGKLGLPGLFPLEFLLLQGSLVGGVLSEHPEGSLVGCISLFLVLVFRGSGGLGRLGRHGLASVVEGLVGEESGCLDL